MAENQIPANKVATAIGLTQPAFSRRYTGEVEWSVDQLFDLARAFGMPFADLCANRDLNPEPADSEPPVALTVVDGGLLDNVVVPFPVRNETAEVLEFPRPVFEFLAGGAA